MGLVEVIEGLLLGRVVEFDGLPREGGAVNSLLLGLLSPSLEDVVKERLLIQPSELVTDAKPIDRNLDRLAGRGVFARRFFAASHRRNCRTAQRWLQ